MTGSITEKNSFCSQQEEGIDYLMDLAGACILAYLRGEPAHLCQESAAFLLDLEILWKQKKIDSQQVWAELDERITLSDDLLRRGIRARKGGPYRSTKLP